MSHEIYDLSIIIPTYNNTEYLDECINSILDSGDGFNYEVLFGIDGCEKTFDYFKSKELPDNFKVYIFEENGGPYTIKNTLASISNSRRLMFFDSDDVMGKEMIRNTIENIGTYVCIKPKYVDFTQTINNSSKNQNFGEGVFSIKKDFFLNMNGFEPWICAADSDYMIRLRKSKTKILQTEDILFYRRIHNNGLTSKPETGYRSILRQKYVRMTNNKVGIGNPESLSTRLYRDINSITSPIEFTENKSMVDNSDKINILLTSDQKRKRVEKVEINYNDINKTKETIKTVRKDVKLTPNDRQKLIDNKKNSKSLNNVSKSLFKHKPNRRLDLPNVNLGRDNLRIG
jgi:glycosyltransferase involved in cell wall biosynthesis